jgi:hypothetical protein
MIRNILGEIQLEPKDYLTFIKRELDSQFHFGITVNEQTAHGFFTEAKIPNVGLYCLYRQNVLIYVGFTENSIRMRIGRFIAAVRGTEHPDENHSAGYKYLEKFGKDLSDLTFKYCEIKPSDLPSHIRLQDLEQCLIDDLKPLFNTETYDNYVFENIVRIRQRN